MVVFNIHAFQSSLAFKADLQNQALVTPKTQPSTQTNQSSMQLNLKGITDIWIDYSLRIDPKVKDEIVELRTVGSLHGM